jgi:dTDP-4-dehydrorhamnose reductase
VIPYKIDFAYARFLTKFVNNGIFPCRFPSRAESQKGNMNILVTGANGQLGTELRNVTAGSHDNYIFTDVTSLPGIETINLDITDIDAVRIVCESDSIDVIVNCAAYTDVDKAEDDPSKATLINCTAAGNLAKVAAERNAALIHISTDYVFHGDVPMPCKEDWPTDPSGVYGSTKLAGERAIRESGCRSIIFRTAWLYSPYGKNFVKTMLRLTAEKDSIKVVFDQIGTPTYAHDLASLIVRIIDGNQLEKTGTYHFSNEGAVSWYDFAEAIREISGNDCDIRPCHTEEYPSKACRPRFSVLDKTKVKSTFGITIPYWRESLKDCIERMK